MMRKKTKAVALQYDGESPPLVTAKGEGRLAKQIIASAKKNGIPLEQNEELTELLAKVRIKEEIPQALYLAVSQILVYLYFLDEQQS